MTKVILIFSLLAVVGAAGAVWFFLREGPGAALGPQGEVEGLQEAAPLLAGGTSETPRVPREVPSDASEYRSEGFAFSLLYPKVMTVKGFDEGPSSQTITFEDTRDPNNLQGFQIFIAPFARELTRDTVEVPGAHSFEEVLVNGVKGLAFVSSDGALGELREVWFVQGGHLYQVVTPRSQEQTLLEVLQTWLFI